MDKELYQRMQLDLAKAIKEKDVEKIAQLKQILNISDEQAKYFEKGLTGYPSIDKVWLKYYGQDAEQYVSNIPLNKTVWDVIEEKILEYYDIPALEYFGKLFSRLEFRDLCYTWARTFRAMGVSENEIVPVYGPFVPDICAMVFGLNMIGACPYFLKLAITPEALEEETRDAKIAVVFDGMWGKVAKEFSKPKFKNVIVASAPMDMPSPLKQIVSFKDSIDAIKNKSRIPDEKKYIWADKARDIANYYSGNVKVPFVSNRNTFITSSSGTTVGGVVKGTIATNETAITQLLMGDAADNQFFPSDRCLNHFPPTASTSLNLIYLFALYRGLTVFIDPRVSEKDFYNQIMKIQPHVAVNTGSMWEAFFNRIEREMSQGKKFDFSYAKVWVVGGEGTDVSKITKWNRIMKLCNNDRGMISGYGTSELFSAACTEKINARCSFDKPIIGVGVPYSGLVAGVYDDNGVELTYNQRGNIRFKGDAIMKGYYNKPKLTSETIEDGWLKTGDFGEIDENGFVYIWGRTSDSISLENGEKLYLFDVAHKIKSHYAIDDAIVLKKPIEGNKNGLVAHIVWKKEYLMNDKKTYLNEINNILKSFLPNGIELLAYYVHDTMLPYSPTTLKKDKNKMAKQNSDFIQVIDDNLVNVDFELNKSGNYELKQKMINKKLRLRKH